MTRAECIAAAAEVYAAELERLDADEGAAS